MKKRLLAALLTCVMLFSMLPATAFAEETPDAKLEVTAVGAPSAKEGETQLAAHKVKIGNTEYDTLEAAVTAAASGDTIQLGTGNYTLYKVNSTGHTKGKDLTFVGQGADKTGWNIGAEVPDPANFGTEYNGDYSFDGAGTVTFKNMTLRSGKANYLGFIRADKTVVEDCIINGKTFYWGYESATFRNTTFNCPDGDYALWTYSSPTMTFDNCTFNSSGKVINVYTDYGAGTHDITVNFKDCTVKNTANNKQVLNVNDSNMGDYKYILNISGNNTVSGVPYDKTTCSRLYGFGERDGNNTGRLDVSIDGTPVWAKSKMFTHKYSAGEQDNAFKYSYGAWTNNGDGTESREVTKTCKYCSYEETYTETKDAEPIDWNVPKSKTATNLDSNFESQVTLSLPSAEKPLVTDVVFVLDKSTSTDVRNAAVKMLSDLNEQVKATSAKVKVGVVIFNMEDHRVLELTELNDYNFETIQSKIQSNEGISGGTNTHAGLLAGKAMLDDDDEVDYSRKYLIFVSDGITYIFDDDEGVATSIFTENFYHETGEIKSSLDMSMEGAMFKYLYGTNIFASTTIPEYLGQVKSWMDADGKAYWVPYGSPAADANAKLASHTNANGAKNVTDEEYAERVNGNDAWDHANNLDTALYLTDKVYQEAVAAGYHCYAMKSKDTDNTNYPWASIFMEYLAGGKTVDFSAIQNDILYLLGPGSTIVDEIGHTSDYNFDLVVSEGKCPFTLTVGGVAYKAEPDGDNAWVFYAPADDSGVSDDAVAEPKPDFRIEYNNTDTAKETITWTINTNVSNFAPVQLTYTVKLTNPKTAPDTYGKYDADGSEGYAGLYTNNSATLYPVDSEGNGNYVPEKFNKPTVSYTVEKPSTPSGGSSSGGGSPVLNTDDHYSYIIGYKDGYLRPYGTITRGEVATIFFRLLTDEARDKYWSQTNDYSDCNSDLWCNNAISTLSNMGIIDGYTDGTFRPYGKITRAQFAKIAVGFFETTKKEYQGYYSDVPENAWFTDYVEAASRVGLIQGFEDGTFRPNTNITRAQACVIVNRALNRKPDEDHLLPEKQMVTWPDNNPGDWYYADMQEATNSHDYTWLSKGSEKKYMEDWTKKLEQRNWAAFEHAWSTAHSAPGGEVVK